MHWSALGFPSRGGDVETISKLLCQIFLKTHQIIHCSNFSIIWQNFGWLQCCWWWCVCLPGLAGAGYSSSPALCAALYRPDTTGYVPHSGGPAQPAEAASSTAYSPAATLSSSHYYYHILTLYNCSVCRVKYQGASDVKMKNVHGCPLKCLFV